MITIMITIKINVIGASRSDCYDGVEVMHKSLVHGMKWTGVMGKSQGRND